MSKNKKANKALVRNQSAPVRSHKTAGKTNKLKKVHFMEDAFSDVNNSSFSAPEFCSLLQLAEEMKAVRNAQGSAFSLPEVSKSKHLNFLPREKIYHDLVGLDVPNEVLVNDVKSQAIMKLKKDPELDFSKYITQNLEPEYFFTSCAVSFVKNQKSAFNGHSIYNKIAIWKECNDQY